KALTKTIRRKGSRGKREIIIIKPSERLLYAVYFSLGMVACLTVLEAIHLIVLGRWNSEIFAAITGLLGAISGMFISQKT
ncbi:hypothetical protein H5T51_01635, partial [Candidatus Bathyarchaeota archaeon]|nr:hypothetical protein [Candidatus Bathyarchaeota archaeon]